MKSASTDGSLARQGRNCMVALLAAILLFPPIAAAQTVHENASTQPGGPALPGNSASPADPASRGHPASPADPASIARAAAAGGKLLFHLTTPEELRALLGAPTAESRRSDGGMEILIREYGDVQAAFGRMRDGAGPFTLVRLAVRAADEARNAPAAGQIDIGRERMVVLRDAGDLVKFDAFWGFAGVSLAKVDLREQVKLLDTMPFDTRTIWPPAERLPKGFDPERVLEDGKDPGLGVRGLHARGIDGRGVHIAIIDQPLTPNHREFAEQVESYKGIDVAGVPPQMHGPPVASIAVGRTCGVAPRASLHYFAVPSWKGDNDPYCDAIEAVIEHNANAQPADRVRVISISTGMFPQQTHYDRWQETLKQATDSGILVLTCLQAPLEYGMLACRRGGDRDAPDSYAAGKYGVRPGALLVPAGGRTTASHHGPDVYAYWVEGGMSWATPYVAGLSALGYQVNPELSPAAVLDLLRSTATKTAAGLIVNPAGFVEAARRAKTPGSRP